MIERKEMDRAEWLCYMLGYMVSKGWAIPKDDIDSFKKSFPEIPEDLIEKSTEGKVA